MNNAQTEGLWKGTKAGGNGPLLSTLFFADDLMFIGQATEENAAFLNELLHSFSVASGEKVNNAKSLILFSKNVKEDRKKDILQICPFKESTWAFQSLIINNLRRIASLLLVS